MLALVEHSQRRNLCPYCGGKSRVRFAAGDWNQRSSTETFVYRRCNACSLIFVQTLPEDIKRYYVHEQYDIPPDAEDFGPRASSQSWKLDLLKPYVTGGNMLEVGPATGEFATIARHAGFKPRLVEMDPECCAFLRDALRHDVIQSDDPASCLRDGDVFDVICVWQAIEHVPRFWHFMERAARQLRPGGVFAISTPNPDSFQARLMGRYWPHGDAPRHLYLIPPKWFERACQAWSLRVAIATTRDEGSIGLNYYGWYLWVRNWPGRHLSPQRVNAWAAKLTNVCRRWETREGQGCSYVLIMLKEQAA